MRFIGALLLSALAVSAAPERRNSPCKGCNADNCLRAVRASSAKPFASSATADCSSFLRKTVTPCASTTTTTSTVTVTASPTFATVTYTDLETQVTTIVTPVTYVATTLEFTETVVTPVEVDVTEIVVLPVTVTAAPQRKRAEPFVEPLPPTPSEFAVIKPRAPPPTAKAANTITTTATTPTTTTAAGTCPATTRAPSAVPTYASACSGTARYSSACSCAGIKGSTTTLTQATVTATSITTSTITPTSTLTATATIDVPVTDIETTSVPITFATTDATEIIASSFTVVNTVIVPTTVVVQPAPTCFQFVATSGFRAGQFLTGGTPDTNLITYGFVNFTANLAEAMAFQIHSDGRVYGGGNQYGWTTNGNSAYYILQMTETSQATYGIRSVFCTVGQGDSSYPGAVGMLSCTSGGRPAALEYCPQFSNNLGQTPGTSTTPGCTAPNFAAIPAICS